MRVVCVPRSTLVKILVCFFAGGAMLHAREDTDDADLPSLAWYFPVDLLRSASGTLLANRSARAHAVDVQYWKPHPRSRPVFQSTCRRAAGSDLDDTRIDRLVCLCRVAVGPRFEFHSCPRWWTGRLDDRAEVVSNGSSCVALCVWLVPGGPTALALCHNTGLERESRPRNRSGLGRHVSDLLVFLACSDGGCSGDFVVVRNDSVGDLAARILKPRILDQFRNQFTQVAGLSWLCQVRLGPALQSHLMI